MVSFSRHKLKHFPLFIISSTEDISLFLLWGSFETIIPGWSIIEVLEGGASVLSVVVV